MLKSRLLVVFYAFHLTLTPDISFPYPLKCFFLTQHTLGPTGKKTFWGGEEKVREAYLFFSEQNVLGWAGYPMG